MKILFVCEYYPPHIGGVEFLFHELARGLASKGHECHVVTCRVPGTSAYEEIEQVKIHRVKVPSKGDRYWFAFLAIPKVLAVGKEVNLIHTTTFSSAFPAWLISKLVRKKCIITVHEVWGSLWKSLAGMNWFSARLHQLLEKVVVTLPFDRYVCPSNHTCDRLISCGVSQEKSAVVHSGVDYELFDPSKAGGQKIREKLRLGNGFIYMYYGRPGTSKGLEYLVSAIPVISERIPGSRLLLILGKKPKNRYEAIRKMIMDLNVERETILLDPVPRNELPEYIAASDCVVVPSLTEGFGLTAVEACAMEKPVVASNVASLPEVVSGKYVLVEPKDPEAIAEGVEKVYKGEVEYSPPKVFSCDECVREYLKVYSEVLGKE